MPTIKIFLFLLILPSLLFSTQSIDDFYNKDQKRLKKSQRKSNNHRRKVNQARINNANQKFNDFYQKAVNSNTYSENVQKPKKNFLVKDAFGNNVNNNSIHMTKDAYGNIVSSSNPHTVKDAYGNFQRNTDCITVKDAFGNYQNTCN